MIRAVKGSLYRVAFSGKDFLSLYQGKQLSHEKSQNYENQNLKEKDQNLTVLKMETYLIDT